MKDYGKMTDEALREEWTNNPPKCKVITGTTDKATGVTIFRKEDIQDLLEDEDVYEDTEKLERALKCAEAIMLEYAKNAPVGSYINEKGQTCIIDKDDFDSWEG